MMNGSGERDSEKPDPDAIREEIAETRAHMGELAEELGTRLETAHTVVQKTLSPIDFIKQHKAAALVSALAALGATALLGVAIARTRAVRVMLAVLLRRPSLLLPR